MRRALVALAFACALGGADAARAADACAPAALYLVRHAEKAAAIGGDGDVNLSDAGRARAQALLAWFGARPLQAIYATHLRRTQQTALPLAGARGLDLRVLSADASAALLQRLRERHCGEHVLVVGHSNTVPEFAQAFGATPFEIAESEFGTIYTLHPPATDLQRERFGADPAPAPAH